MKKFGSLENAYKPNVSEAYIYSENCLYVVQIISRMMKLAMWWCMEVQQIERLITVLKMVCYLNHSVTSIMQAVRDHIVDN